MNWAELYTAIVNTLLVLAGVIGIALPISILLAIALVRTNVWGAGLAWLAVCSQLLVPLYALVGAWSAGFGTQGWWPLSQVSLAGTRPGALAAVIFIHAMAAIPAGVLSLSAGLYWTRRSREELALLEGGKRNWLRQALLPELHGWIAAASLWMIVPVLTEMVVTNLYQVPTVAEQVYLDISLGTDSWRTYGVAIALSALPLALLAWLLRSQLPTLASVAQQAAEHPLRVLELGSWRVPLSLVVWLIVLAMVFVPLANLMIKAGWQTRLGSDGLMQYGWSSARWWQTGKETTWQFTREFRWSAALAASSATLALGLAAAMRAASGVTARPQLRSVCNAICLGLIALPGPLVSAGLMRLFLGLPGLAWLYDHTLAAPILAQQTRLLPLAWLLVGGIVWAVSRPAWELALLDQLSWWQRWRTLLWRPARQLWLLSWLLLATLSVGELSTHLLLLPPGVTTVAQRLFELLHFGMRYQDSGLCLALMALGWVVAGILWANTQGLGRLFRSP